MPKALTNIVRPNKVKSRVCHIFSLASIHFLLKRIQKMAALIKLKKASSLAFNFFPYNNNNNNNNNNNITYYIILYKPLPIAFSSSML